jgi:hypothetical protein
MADSIFVLDAQNNLIPMQLGDYDAEDVLQRLVAEHPELLPLALSEGEGTARWLLVAREAGIADDSGGDRFAVDHVLLDGEGVPTLVEVKRSTDTRIRREVVGQMLDYASHFVIHWTAERVQAHFEATCAALGVDSAERLAEHIGTETDPETFWQRVKTNLLARRVRLLFVADRIPPELRRVVEFLNAVTDPVEVLAVEVPQYTGRGMKTFVPRVIGQTVEARERKHGEKRRWNEADFFAALERAATPGEVAVARRLFAWALERKLRIWWGQGSNLGSFYVMVDHRDLNNHSFSVWTEGSVQVSFREMAARPTFADEARRLELLDRINAAAHTSIPSNKISKLPTFPLSALTDPQALDGFLAVWDWYLGEIRGYGSA